MFFPTGFAKSVCVAIASIAFVAITGLVHSAEVNVGGNVTLSVTVDGTPPFSYQWQKDGTTINGANSATYSLTNVQKADFGDYSVVVSNSAGNVTAPSATLVPPNMQASAVGTSTVADPNSGGFLTSAGAILMLNASSRPATFDALGYLARNPDVAAAIGNDLNAAWQHYMNYGINEGRVFDDSFRVDEYMWLYGDLQAVFANNRQVAVLYWLTYGRAEGRLGRVPPTFDWAQYLANSPDLMAAFGSLSGGRQKATVWNHYLNYGVNEGRTDGDFDVRAYLAQYGDLQAAFGNDLDGAALHWYIYGRYEGRRIPAGFDVQGYLTRNPDVQAAVGLDLYGGWLHYWNYGLNEGRVYDDLFRVDQYLALYADLRAAFGTNRQAALLHWLRYGRAEGRRGRF